jgi:hypothetical protein
MEAMRQTHFRYDNSLRLIAKGLRVQWSALVTAELPEKLRRLAGQLEQATDEEGSDPPSKKA